MSEYTNGNWHNFNGGGLPFRGPPRFDEALPYSPFTSIIPFSLDVIPFPTTGPPHTSPSTLTPDQQNAARKAVNVLNDEVKGHSVSRYLPDTLEQLRRLLDPDRLPEYRFKDIPELATSLSESPSKETSGSTSSPSLSPFANLLLKQTDVSFSAFSVRALERPRPDSTILQRSSLPQQPQVAVKASHVPTQVNVSVQIPRPAQLVTTVSSSKSSSVAHPSGPTVMIQPNRIDHTNYKHYNQVSDYSSEALPNPQASRAANDVTILKPHEREIADRRKEELQSLVEALIDERDGPDDSSSFERISTPDGDLNVLQLRTMMSLHEKMSNIINLGRFATLPVPLIMNIQSLLQPSVLSATKNGLFSVDDGVPELSSSIAIAKKALQASKYLLDTMIEGRDDHRMRREEMIEIIIDLIKLIKDACIVPIVESRRSGVSEGLFKAATSEKKNLQDVLRVCGHILSRFGALIGKFNLPDRALNTLEYLTLELLVEQNSDHEKDSIFTITRFEQFRQKSMDVLSQIFARHEVQRNSILNGIFSNLEKLPDKKASARQFKSAKGSPIMTMSALFMRFIQVAATNRERSNTTKDTDAFNKESEEAGGSDYEPGKSTHTTATKTKKCTSPVQIAQSLTTNAIKIAAYIVQSLIERASNVSKAGDKPFRNLLDLFIEDFCNVLGSPEWPAAIMLLQQLLVRMVTILQGDQAAKQSVVDKDMALTTMARIGCGILDFKYNMARLKQQLDISQSDLSAKLDRMAEEALSDDVKERVNDLDLFALDGPYRIVIESMSDFLDLQRNQEDLHMQSGCGCYVSSWLSAVLSAFLEQDESEWPRAVTEIKQYLEAIIMDPKWQTRNEHQVISESQSRLAAGIIALHSQLCRYLPRMVDIMVTHTREKASSKLRSRAITALGQLIDKDAGIIGERSIIAIANSLSDASPMVRESTLSLVSTCLERQPSLEKYVLSNILNMTTDPSNAPKKKAIKMLKDLYFSSSSLENQQNIAISLLLPSQDVENSISELSRNVLEEIWLTNAKSSTKSDESKLKLNRTQRASFMIDVVEILQGVTAHLEAFENFFRYALSAEARASKANVQICKDFIADMIDKVIDTESGSSMSSQARIMTALSIFAKVEPTLFSMGQIETLKLYIKEIATAEDLALVRPTVVIFRHVFPTLPSLQRAFAEEVRVSLMKNINKLANYSLKGGPTMRQTLVDVAHCLWTISSIPDIGPTILCTTIASILCQLRPLLATEKTVKDDDDRRGKRISQYLILLGTFGKVCNFDEYIETFRAKLGFKTRELINKNPATKPLLEPLLDEKSSAGLILLDTVRPFTTQAWDMNVRAHAIESLGGICQQSPQLFMRAEVEQVVKLVFANEGTERLKRIVLSFFAEYFTFAERRSESGAQIAVGKGASTGTARLETSFVANENDSATLHLAQKFLSRFVDAALTYKDELAILATDVIASISRQGLVHPKECGAALVALGTSPNQRIAETASTEHRRIHEKQESYLEKEYMQAIRMAFDYQCHVFDDPHGMVETTHTPKLGRLFEAMKRGKKATFKKFIVNLCKQIDFDVRKLDSSGDPPRAVLFARFCLENMALLDLPHLEELSVFLNETEAMVLRNTGPAVALLIETELPKSLTMPTAEPMQFEFEPQPGELDSMGGIDPVPSEAVLPNLQVAEAKMDDARLRQVTTACMILQMVWETRSFVRRCYNVHKTNSRIAQKDHAKPTTRNHFVSAKELLERLVPIMSALDSRDLSIKQCYDFADLLEIDRDAHVDEEVEDGGLDGGYETPADNADEETGTSFPTSGRGRKRKSNVSLSNTPKKAKGRAAGARNKKLSSRTPDGDDDSE